MKDAEIEAALKTVTDRLDKLDPLIKGKGFLYFRCLHSMLFFPADYVSQWGRKYGVGIGGEVRSECLDSMYEVKPAINNDLVSIDQIMHPCKVSGAPLDAVFTTVEAKPAELVIPAQMDMRGIKRGKLMLAKQIKNPRSRVAFFRAMYTKQFDLNGGLAV